MSNTPVENAPTKGSMPQTTTTGIPNSGLHGKQLALVFTGLLLAMFVSSISETIAATALPTIVGDLGGVEMMQWVSTTYILSSTIMMPIYGRLGDTLGRKGLLIFALIVYTLGKIICAIAPTMAFLLLGRLVSGVGGGGLIILSQAALADIVPTRTRGKYLGVMGAVFAMDTVLGPLLGGWFVQVTGWRMIFWFTVPLAIIAIAFLAIFFKIDSPKRQHIHFDTAGCIAMAVSVTAIVLAISWGGNLYPWISYQILGLFALFIASTVIFVLIERKAQKPLIPMTLFHNRNFVICSLAGMLIYAGIMGAISYLPTYFQIVDKMAPVLGGLMITPMSIGMFITSTASGFIASKTGKYKWMTLVMAGGGALGLGLFGTLSETQPIVITLAIFGLSGLFVGFGTQILVLVVQNEFPHAIVGTATAANNFFRQIGSTIGTSLVGSLFTSRLTADLLATLPKADNLTIASITPSLVDKLPASTQQIIAAGYSDALVPLFIYFIPLAIISFALLLFLQENPLKTTIDK